jgi:cysteine desulfurase/selenocysteine lyase
MSVDVEALARLANQFFAALPGTEPQAAVAAATPPHAPQPPELTAPIHGLGVETPPNVGAIPSVYGPPIVPAVPNVDLAFEGPASVPAAKPEPAFYFLEFARPPAGFHLPATAPAHAPLDVDRIRADFPILRERVNGRPLIWFDNGATTQKPQAVIDRLTYFYEHENSNIHRAAHELAARSTDAYEGARETVRRFINARSTNEIVFVRGATEGVNLVAKGWGAANIGRDDEILLTQAEHHANIVPWQQLAEATGARIRVAPLDDRGELHVEEFAKLLSPRTKLAAFTQVSNALGTVLPAPALVALAHGVGAKVLIDGAQSVAHLRTDVQSLDADFFVFSGHKVFGPTGIGVVYGKEDLLNASPPWQGGGNMIKDVTFERTTYHQAPARFEAGTGNIADAVGLACALEYVERVGIDAIHAYEAELLAYGTRALSGIAGLRLIGTAPEKAAILSFVLDGQRIEDVGTALNREGIAVRAGHHCAQPSVRRFGLEGTVRASLAFYNTFAEIDVLTEALRRISSPRIQTVVPDSI